jgi:hypothetical protein
MPVSRGIQKWEPIVGECTNTYLTGLEDFDQSAIERIQANSVAILGNCENPNSPNPYSESGLVLGYVQSGKTQSFTTVTVLARDNGYGVVILLAGVTNLLKHQSIERMAEDLGMKEEYSDDWKAYESPGIKENGTASPQASDVKDRIKTWAANHSRHSVLITILKHGTHIDNLKRLLETIDMSNVPVLLIDDESDQATPNNKSKINLSAKQLEEEREESSSRIHGAVKSLRSVLPKHTYLQYTATPQANLLASKADVLSPAFARVLDPGDLYTGGSTFFGEEGLANNVRSIPKKDIINPRDLPDEVPETLLAALRSFWLGCAVRLFEEKSSKKKKSARSMMIQVSAQTIPHKTFNDWTSNNKTYWRDVLSSGEGESFTELMSSFQETHADLRSTYPTMPDLPELLDHLIDAISDTRVAIVNSTADAVATVKWWDNQFWILIGGMKLDRGFTVKGITTTYMPRTMTTTPDTLQQRARFFGYHYSYLGLVRVFLSDQVKTAFEKYVIHETALRTSLAKFQGRPLIDWKKSFILDPVFRNATRPSVIGINLDKFVLKPTWVKSRYLHADPISVQSNEKVFEKYLAVWREKYMKVEHPKSWVDKRESSNKHVLLAGIPMKELISFLIDLNVPESRDVSTMLLVELCALNALDRKPDLVADVVLINDLDQSKLQSRILGPTEPLDNIFIGRNPQGASLKSLTYVGDEKIYTENTTVHLRFAKILNPEDNKVSFVPWISIRPSVEISTAIVEEKE